MCVRTRGNALRAEDDFTCQIVPVCRSRATKPKLWGLANRLIHNRNNSKKLSRLSTASETQNIMFTMPPSESRKYVLSDSCSGLSSPGLLLKTTASLIRRYSHSWQQGLGAFKLIAARRGRRRWNASGSPSAAHRRRGSARSNPSDGESCNRTRRRSRGLRWESGAGRNPYWP